ncbi:MAG: DNA/RNA non-specific endonuclease [Nitrospirales bacterium]|nr:DNA/RNA non-specific endonuclease [Nitrospirales bacterium]
MRKWMRLWRCWLALIWIVGSVVVPSVSAQCTRAIHTFCGIPKDGETLVRQGYLLSYDADRRIPGWVAYKIEPDFLHTPERDNRLASFLRDPDVPTPVVSSDYTYLEARRGYVRGHLAPWKVMGGDRDGDGIYAHLDSSLSDPDDELTIRQVNFMSNIVPQHDDEFNGQGGLWGKLERWIQDEIVADDGKTVWVVAGTIFGPQVLEKVGPDHDIHVPPMFFKVMIEDDFTEDAPRVLAFLFPHQRGSHGDITDFLVTLDVIEAMTGLDFFRELPGAVEARIEDTDTCVFWDEYYSPWWQMFSSSCD